MKTKDIEIDWNGSKGLVKIKRLSFGEKNQLIEEATNVKMMGGNPIVNVSQKALKEISLLKSIVSAPFTIDLKTIQELDSDIGEKLFMEFTELNQQDLKQVG